MSNLTDEGTVSFKKVQSRLNEDFMGKSVPKNLFKTPQPNSKVIQDYPEESI